VPGEHEVALVEHDGAPAAPAAELRDQRREEEVAERRVDDDDVAPPAEPIDVLQDPDGVVRVADREQPLGAMDVDALVPRQVGPVPGRQHRDVVPVPDEIARQAPERLREAGPVREEELGEHQQPPPAARTVHPPRG
jgi:hypothetical protein